MKLSESPSPMGGRLALVILAVALLFSAFVRWRLRDMPLERDEGGFGFMAQLLLQGVPPYQLAYDEKLPGIYLAYAAMMAAFGESAAGIHLGLMIVNLATVVLIFLLVRDLFDSLAGGIAAATYSLLAVSPSVLGMAAHATHFVTFFGVAATWTLWRALHADKKPLLFWSGLFFGTALLMKQHGVFLSGFGGLMLLIHYTRLRPFAWRKLWNGLAAFAAGVVLPYAATCLWLWWAGVFDRFWFWTVTFSRNHVSEISWADGVRQFWEQFIATVTPNWPLWVAALLGALLVVRTRNAKEERWFLWAYFGCSFLCICPGLFFRPHYFIVLLPAVAIFNGAAGSWLLHSASCWRPKDRNIEGARQQSVDMARHAHRNARAPRAKTVDAGAAASGILVWPAGTLLLAAAAFGVWWQREFFFLWTPTRACQETYPMFPFLESITIADYLSRHTTPEQRVAVIGSEPQMYFYSRRLPATGYITIHSLVERQPFALQMQQEMCRQIEAAKPEFIVFVHVDSSWLAQPNYCRFVWQWASRYVESHYRLVGLADIISPTRTDYQWGDQAARAYPLEAQYVWIFQRKK